MRKKLTIFLIIAFLAVPTIILPLASVFFKYSWNEIYIFYPKFNKLQLIAEIWGGISLILLVLLILIYNKFIMGAVSTTRRVYKILGYIILLGFVLLCLIKYLPLLKESLIDFTNPPKYTQGTIEKFYIISRNDLPSDHHYGYLFDTGPHGYFYMAIEVDNKLFILDTHSIIGIEENDTLRLHYMEGSYRLIKIEKL